jgi:hypothetical protein
MGSISGIFLSLENLNFGSKEKQPNNVRPLIDLGPMLQNFFVRDLHIFALS